MTDTEAVSKARRFLNDEEFAFSDVNALWRQLKKEYEFSLARRVLEQIRKRPEFISDGVPTDAATKNKLCQQEAELTSKDPELYAATRHDDALKLLSNGFSYLEHADSSDKGGSV